MNRNNKQVTKNQDNVWVSIMLSIPMIFLVYYFVIGPLLADNSGLNEGLIVSLSVALGLIGIVLASASVVLLHGMKRWFSLFGFLGGVAFFVYAFVVSTFSLAF